MSPQEAGEINVSPSLPVQPPETHTNAHSNPHSVIHTHTQSGTATYLLVTNQTVHQNRVKYHLKMYFKMDLPDLALLNNTF